MIVVLSDNLENHNIIERKIQVFERTNHIREEMSKDNGESRFIKGRKIRKKHGFGCDRRRINNKICYAADMAKEISENSIVEKGSIERTDFLSNHIVER